MRIIKSPVQQISFWMIGFDFKINPSEKQQKPSELFPQYEVDLDFGRKDNEDIILIYTKVSINQGDGSLPGYSIFAEGITRFRLMDSNAKNKVSIPCINISIQNLRNHVASVTADCPLGKYVFPTINLGEMLEVKKKTSSTKSTFPKKVARRKKTAK